MFTSLARVASASLALAMVLTIAPAARSAERSAAPSDNPQMTIYSPGSIQHGQAHGFARAVADSFNIYGGVRTDGSNDRRPEGMFQTLEWAPLWQNWFGVDRTENPIFWHVSNFNAGNLDPGAGNRAMWSGVDPGTSGFLTSPGYGNNWNDIISWTGTTNPALFTTVQMTFDYNYDVEPNYDYFVVEYDSAGSWIEWQRDTGTNKETDGTFLNAASFNQSVLYTPLMYGGDLNTDIRLRLRVESDGAWSDEDGLWPTKGAVQVDNIRVFFNGALVPGAGGDGVATFEDLGGGVDDTEGWDPVPSEFAGDFAKVLLNLEDIDPCRKNFGPQLGFVDDGTPPSNSVSGTGGTLSTNWQYGVRGNWVVNYNGGVSNGLIPLNNEVWSPEIAWDDPNSVEDDPLVGGAFLRFTVWQHLPLSNGMFWTWGVRSAELGQWSPWLDRNFVYYGDGGGEYSNPQFDVTDLLLANRDTVQIALGVVDLADAFGFPGTDATPSPSFDNVSFWRYNLGGPAFSARNIDLFQDSFPQGGSIDMANPAALAVRMDMARDVSTGDTFNSPGDSIVVDVSATVPGTSLAGPPDLKWILEANPAFDGVRSIPGGAVAAGTNSRGWAQWTGTAAGDSARTSSGIAVAGKFFVDLPNDGPALRAYQTAEPAMFFPGDRIRYFLEALDTDGNRTTMPGDTTGFSQGSGYPRLFTVRALPSIVDDGIGGFTQPDILIVNDFGHRGGENEWLGAMAQNGLVEDEDYDSYTVRGPSSIVSNGIGSAGAHGATSQQLSDYETLLYFAGDLSSGLLSDGTNTGSNDKGDDISLLTAWHTQPGHRHIAYFGDYIATALAQSGAAGFGYMTSTMGVDYGDTSVQDEIGGQSASLVIPAIPGFSTSFIAYGGCLGLNEFDSITPLVGAVASHEFTDPQGTTPYTPVAGVWYARTEVVGVDTWDRVDLTFPYSFSFVYTPTSRAPVGTPSRITLMGEILSAFNNPISPGTATAAPSATRLKVSRNVPNPFNPVTRIEFVAPEAGQLSVKVYNLRGELVRVLQNGEVRAGPGSATWNGIDDRGNPVSSGVYLYEVRGFGERVTAKMALVK